MLANPAIEENRLTWTTKRDEMRYIVYKVENNEATITGITGENALRLSEKGRYCVSAINRDNVESEISEVIEYK